MQEAPRIGYISVSDWNKPLELAARRHRELIARIEPFVKVMVEIRSMQPMRYFIKDGMHVEPEILWMPGSKETYDLCQQMIDHIKQQYIPGGG